jgi:hypothetical protein
VRGRWRTHLERSGMLLESVWAREATIPLAAAAPDRLRSLRPTTGGSSDHLGGTRPQADGPTSLLRSRPFT